MRTYEGSPRQDYEEVLRSIGTFIDEHGLTEILLAQAPEGFMLQGLAQVTQETSPWSDTTAITSKETYTFLDADVSGFLQEAAARRRPPGGDDGPPMARPYERTLRVIGRYLDEQKPKDVFFFEQGGAYVLRLLMTSPQGSGHLLAEFTQEELLAMVGLGPSFRGEQRGLVSG